MNYHIAMSQPTESRPYIDPMRLSAYIVVSAVTAMGLWIFLGDHHPNGRAGVALLAVFDLLVLLPDDALGGLKERWPHLYTGLAAGLILALTLLTPETPWFVVMFFVLSPEVMLRFPRQVGYAWIGAFSALTVVIFVVAGNGALGLLLQAPLYIAGYFFFAAFATQTALANAAQAESQRLLAELQETHERLQAYAAQAEALAVSEERNRLAREMHDTLGHALTMSVVQLEGAQRLAESDPARAAKIIGTVREELRGALAELRRTLTTLRTPLEAALPLPQALAHLAARFEEATRLPVHLTVPAALPDLSAEQRQAFFRAAQEALTNVQRHAEARQVWLELTADGGQVALGVSDDGIGVQPGGEQPGFGLRGLRERAVQLGGTLSLDARPDGGTVVRFALPIMQTAETAGEEGD